MGRQGSTYRARITNLIHICVELTSEEGYIEAQRLAEKAGLTDRMIRTYLNDLLVLQVLEYDGSGKYRISQTLTKEIEERLFDPTSTLSIETLANSPTYMKNLLELEAVQEKVQNIFEKMEYVFRFPTQLRQELLTKKIPSDGAFLLKRIQARQIIGDTLVFPDKTPYKPLDAIIPGSASIVKMQNFRLADFSFLSLTLIAASAFGAIYRQNRIAHEESFFVNRPILKRFSGTEPLEKDDQFYEMLTEFPDLLFFERSIAARYLVEITHLKTDIDLIKRLLENDLPFDIYFRKGALVPHGFTVRTRMLQALRDQCHQYFYELLGLSKKNNIILAAITTTPRDNSYFKLATELLDKELGKMNDLIFLDQIMKDQDTTCLMERHRERGKPQVPDLFDYYWKKDQTLLKIEFASLNSPANEQETINQILGQTCFPPSIPRHSGAGVSSIQQAEVQAYQWLSHLDRDVKVALNIGLQIFQEKNFELRDQELRQKYDLE